MPHGRLDFTYPAWPTIKIGVRYFQAGALANRRRTRWHSIPGGCNRGSTERHDPRTRKAYKLWEQEVYRDAEGQDWIVFNTKGTKFDGWSPVEPCVTCHDKYIDDILADDEWKDKADCQDQIGANWFSSMNTPEVQKAITICNSCPVVVECKDWATRLHLIDPIPGTYAGELETERIRRLGKEI